MGARRLPEGRAKGPPVEPEPSTYTEYRPKYDDEGDFIGIEEVTA